MGFECPSIELEEGMGGMQIKTTNALFPVANTRPPTSPSRSNKYQASKRETY